MIDLKTLREQPEVFQQACVHKNVKVDITKILKLDAENRTLIGQVNQLRTQLNIRSKTKPGTEEIKKLQALGVQIKDMAAKQHVIQTELDEWLYKIPNLPSDDTPIGKDETQNKVLKEVGRVPNFAFPAREHWQLGEELDVIDIPRAAKISGSRFAYLKGKLAELQFALIQHIIGIVTDEKILKKIIKQSKLDISSKPFTMIVPPVLVRPETLLSMGRLEPKEERYYIPSDDQYLVGSAEHSIGSMYMNETLEEKDLPVRYIGYSTAFRREAGSYGKDVKGIWRVHQFDKLEFESFTVAEGSRAEHEFFIALQEYIMQTLNLPYRLIQSCTGDLGDPNARKVDVEAWLPGQKQYRETHSADYMTDFQARRLKTRVKRNSGETQFVHTNDATAIAIGRTLVAIMENYQTADGSIQIPKVLQPFLGGLKKITAPRNAA